MTKRPTMMKWILLAFAGMLFHAVSSAFTLFPEIKDTRVAGTTKREMARCLATDGTNFLVVFQGDNLYAAPDQTNQLAAQLLGPTGTLLGPRLDWSLNGGVPLVEFGTSNFLAAWVVNTNGPALVQGQFLNGVGHPSGNSFVVASNTSAAEVGAMTFACGQFWIVWAQTNAINQSGLLLQRVSESGALFGEPLALGTTNSVQQCLPALSASRTNVLVTWRARRPDTNAWDVLARWVAADGTATPPLVVSEGASAEPHVVAAASDGTNHLVVWSQEAGPDRYFYHGYIPTTEPVNAEKIFTTNKMPRVFARLLTGQEVSTPIIPVSHARWGQVSPSVAFDGMNYLVAWNDRRFANYVTDYGLPNWSKAWYLPATTNQALFLCFIDRAGALVDWEFLAEPFPPQVRSNPQMSRTAR